MKDDAIDQPLPNAERPTARMKQVAKSVDVDGDHGDEDSAEKGDAVDVRRVLSVDEDSSFTIGFSEPE